METADLKIIALSAVWYTMWRIWVVFGRSPDRLFCSLSLSLTHVSRIYLFSIISFRLRRISWFLYLAVASCTRWFKCLNFEKKSFDPFCRHLADIGFLSKYLIFFKTYSGYETTVEYHVFLNKLCTYVLCTDASGFFDACKVVLNYL